MRKSCNENPDTLECPLVRAGLREVLRLYPVATFVGRVLDSDAKIGQYTIPKGWLAIMSLFTSSRDPKNFSDPLEFVPDRWLRADNKTGYKVFKPHGTMPYAMGGRSCIGRKVANFQVHCLITKVGSAALKEKLNLKLSMLADASTIPHGISEQGRSSAEVGTCGDSRQKNFDCFSQFHLVNPLEHHTQELREEAAKVKMKSYQELN